MNLLATEVRPSGWLAETVAAKLRALHQLQTVPFAGLVADYQAAVQEGRELQVRLAQLDKEAAELRDENATLTQRVAQLEEIAAQDFAAQAAEARAAGLRMERELASLYKDKAGLLEEVMAAGAQAAAARAQADSAQSQLTQSRAQAAALREQLAGASAACEAERAARLTASGEVQAALAAREAALVEAERARNEAGVLMRRLVEIKAAEAQRIEDLSRMHEEMVGQVLVQRQEAHLEREAAEIIRQRAAAAAAASSSLAASLMAAQQQQQQQQLGTQRAQAGGGGGGPSSGSGGAAAELANAAAQLSLRDVMVLPPMGSGATSHHIRAPSERVPAKQPRRVIPAHKGGCCSLAPQFPGHFIASCGIDRTVMLWDTSLMDLSAGPAVVLHGMLGAVHDCAFTADGCQVVAAGADKSLHVWDATSGAARHTLTGHTGPVTTLATSPLDTRLAVSCSEDRSFKLWDLHRGYSLRSCPSARMPLALAITRDGNTIATGHIDGGVLLWDIRQCRAGAASPLLEWRDQAQPVCAIATTPQDSLLVVASKDGTIRLWDFRASGAALRTLRHPGFTIGTTGSVGRARCRIAITTDGRLLAAPGADGSVWLWDLLPSHNGGGVSGGGGGGGSAAYAHPGAVGLFGPSNEPRQLRGGHKEGVVAVAWSHDRNWLASADKTGALAFWPTE